MKQVKDYILKNFVRVMIALIIIWLIVTVFIFIHSLKFERSLYQCDRKNTSYPVLISSTHDNNTTTEALKITKVISALIGSIIALSLVFIICS